MFFDYGTLASNRQSELMPKNRSLPSRHVEGLPPRTAFETALWRHVIDAWFPRCLDLTHGGFLSDFDRAWRPCGPLVNVESTLPAIELMNALLVSAIRKTTIDLPVDSYECDQVLDDVSVGGAQVARFR